MSDFSLYFGLGKINILDYANGYDHILFVIALCALYISRDWKTVLVLVTAFTIGHSITLALSTLRIVNVRSELVEFLIPLTIFITAVSNLFKNENNIGTKPMQMNYFYALFFGFDPRPGLFKLPARYSRQGEIDLNTTLCLSMWDSNSDNW